MTDSLHTILDRCQRGLGTCAARALPVLFSLALTIVAVAVGEQPAGAEELAQHYDTPSWSLTWGGYLHLAYRWVQQPANFDLAGKNNGFQLEQARLGANLQYKDSLAARISFEGASEDRVSQSFVGGTLTARLRDAYLTWAPLVALRFSAGQMVTPGDLDSMRSDAELPFVSRAVPVEGVQPAEGRATLGMGTDRSLGLAIHSGDVKLFDVASVRYAAMVANNNGQNQLFNSSNTPAFFGRVEFALWGSQGPPPDQIGPLRGRTDDRRLPWVGLGFAFRYVPRTAGDPPNLVSETDVGYAADVIVGVAGLDLQGGLLYVKTTHDTLSATPPVERFGWWAHLRYTIPGIPVLITPGYRIASYAPRAHLASGASTPSEQMLDDDLGLLFHTVGVSVRPTVTFPMRMSLNYTFTGERGGNVLENDRFELDAVVTF